MFTSVRFNAIREINDFLKIPFSPGRMLKRILALSVGAVFYFAAPASAQTGKIDNVVVSDIGTAFRITLVGSPAMCTGDSYHMAYVDENSTRYDTFVSALVSAHLAKKTVSITATPVAFGSAVACKITYLAVED